MKIYLIICIYQFQKKKANSSRFPEKKSPEQKDDGKSILTEQAEQPIPSKLASSESEQKARNQRLFKKSIFREIFHPNVRFDC